MSPTDAATLAVAGDLTVATAAARWRELAPRAAEATEIRAFADALTNNLVNRYGSALLDIDTGVNVAIKAETPHREGRIVRVATEIERRGGPPVPVDYLFHQVDEEWRVFDVIVEGVSYVQTFRNQFDPLVREKGIAGVTSDLREGRISVDPEL